MTRLVEAHWGTAETPLPDWRLTEDDSADDDEELAQTPQDVIDILGFDPKDYDPNDADDAEWIENSANDGFDPNEPRKNDGEWTTGGGGGGKAAEAPTPAKTSTKPEPETALGEVTSGQVESVVKSMVAAQSSLKASASKAETPAALSTKSGAPPAVHHPHITETKGGKSDVQLSWESAPGHTNHDMEGMHEAPLAQRQEYHEAIKKLIIGADGRDLIAQQFGLRTQRSFDAPGVFQGRVSPGTQSVVTPTAGAYPLIPTERQTIDACEATRGALLRQDAAAWSHPQFFVESDPKKPFLIPAIFYKGQAYLGVTHRTAFEDMPKELREELVAAGMQHSRSIYKYLMPDGKLIDRFEAATYAKANDLVREGVFDQPALISEHLKDEARGPTPNITKEEQNLLDFRLGRPLTIPEAVELTSILSSIAGGFFTPIGAATGFRLLNVPDFSGMTNVEFKSAVVKAIEAEDTSLPDMTLAPVRADANYLENDWSKNPHGESYRNTIAATDRSDLVGTADQLFASLGPKIDAVQDEFARKYGWKPDVETRFWDERATKAEDHNLASDRAPQPSDSTRSYDDFGRLHVASAHITAAAVNEYYGREIPNAKALGLDPARRYKLFRDPDELSKAVATFNNIPLLSRHVGVTARDHKPDLVIGSTGTDAVFKFPYLDNSLVVWAGPDIEKIEEDLKRALSCSYSYRADPSPGTFEGQAYDIVMRDIKANHLAVVTEGRVDGALIGDASISENQWRIIARALVGV